MQLQSQFHNEGDELRKALPLIRGAVERIWRHPLHRYYTDHTVLHSLRVIEKLNGLVSVSSGSHSLLFATEKDILEAAAYLHDIGMQDERFGSGDLTEEQIRDQHHQITRELIRNRYLGQSGENVPLGLESVPIDIVNNIALVAEAHRRTDLSQDKYRAFDYRNERIRPRLLAALLRFADELDLDHQRVYMENLPLMKIRTLSRFHWYVCYYVSAVRIEGGLVQVSYRFPEGCEHYEQIIMPLVERKIQAEYDGLSRILWNHGVKVTIGEPAPTRYVEGLEPMPSEVESIARGKCRQGYQSEIAKYSERVLYLDSFESTQAAEIGAI
ncbi:MAG: HD domain-containing protein [Planctomycetota bacterium]|jgi:hypothetical protein